MGVVHSCNTSQSATSLTPALRFERHERTIDGAERAHAAFAPIRLRQLLELGPDVRIRQRAIVGARGQHFDIAQQRRHGAQVRRQLFALAVAAGAGFREQFLRAFEPPRRVLARGRVLEHPLGDARALRPAPPRSPRAPGRGCRRPWRRPRALRSRCVRARPARTRSRRPPADGSAAADSASAPSPAARRAGPSRE